MASLIAEEFEFVFIHLFLALITIFFFCLYLVNPVKISVFLISCLFKQPPFSHLSQLFIFRKKVLILSLTRAIQKSKYLLSNLLPSLKRRRKSCKKFNSHLYKFHSWKKNRRLLFHLHSRSSASFFLSFFLNISAISFLFFLYFSL